MTTLINALTTGGGGLAVTGDSSGILALQTSNVTAVTVDASQNVGIGTTTPSTGTLNRQLTINSGASNLAGVVIQNNATGTAYSDGTYLSTLNTSDFQIVNQEAGYVSIGTNSLERMRIDSSGYLLVGYTTSNGAYKLQVNSQIFATSSTIATSDAKYKTDVLPISGALDIVNALNPVEFNWKKHPIHAFDTTNKTVGFLAQEVETVLKDKPYVNSIIKKNICVLEPEEKDEENNITKEAVTEDFLGIAEGNMIAILTKAIQEQQTIINDLKARITALEGAK